MLKQRCSWDQCTLHIRIQVWETGHLSRKLTQRNLTAIHYQSYLSHTAFFPECLSHEQHYNRPLDDRSQLKSKCAFESKPATLTIGFILNQQKWVLESTAATTVISVKTVNLLFCEVQDICSFDVKMSFMLDNKPILYLVKKRRRIRSHSFK